MIAAPAVAESVCRDFAPDSPFGAGLRAREGRGPEPPAILRIPVVTAGAAWTIVRRTMKAAPLKIVWNDWPAFFSSCAIPLIWIIHFAFPYLKRGGSAPLGFTFGLAGCAVLALGWRVARVERLLGSGGSADGVVEAVRFGGDRGRLEYTYRVGDRVLSGWCAVRKSRQVQALRVGQQITVAFDLRRPERSIVADLFAVG